MGHYDEFYEAHEKANAQDGFTIKDSGARTAFEGGMVRDTTEGKTNFLNVRFGPMLKRWAAHTTKGREKYPDVAPGVPNWTLAQGVDEYLRFKESAARHFEQWLAGDRDEDHAAAVLFNINGAEYVMEKDESIDPSTGASPPPEPKMGPKVHVYENGTALPCLCGSDLKLWEPPVHGVSWDAKR